MASTTASIPPSKPLYQYEESLRKHVARITCVRPYSELEETEKLLFKAGTDDTLVLETHETIFYAQGGGQPCDVGHITAIGEEGGRFEVQLVRSGANGRILHFGHFTNPSSPRPTPKGFAVGDMVEQTLDGERRDLHSRIHTAGHLVALAVLRLSETTQELKVVDDKAQHYPETSFVEFKGVIDSKFKEAIQDQANEFVRQALPVKLYWLKPEELEGSDVILAEGMPVLTGLDGMVRIVDIVGAGAYPCGGTHTQDTSLVGQITVKGIKRQKGVSKVSYFVEGQR
ncbi:hypothetical protein LTR86_008178 [Recurvomyces mirabilis]|nr:hypothetical protein LTR86_008178 [Recurvomyces mirabilis]